MSEPTEGPEPTPRRTPVQDDITATEEGDSQAAEAEVKAEAAEPTDGPIEPLEGAGAAAEAQVEIPDFRDQRIQMLEQALEEREDRLQNYIRAHRKAQADFDGFKDRMRANEESHKEAARGKVVERMLSVYDNLQRSLEASRTADAFDDLRAGVELVTRDFLQRLEEMGLRRFDPIGMPFDPACMEALGVVPVAEDERNGTVVMTLQPGFRLENRELRPAKVQVGRKF